MDLSRLSLPSVPHMRWQAVVKMLRQSGFEVFAMVLPRPMFFLRADGGKIDVIRLDMTIPGFLS